MKGVFQMKYLSILLVFLALFQLNCGNRNREAETVENSAEREDNRSAKVKVDERGDIYLNKKRVSLEALDKEFTRIKKVNGFVWYYRSAQGKAADASGLDVMKKIMDYQLPVKLCPNNDPCMKDFE
jgi:biopolymer transport protein ExbD